MTSFLFNRKYSGLYLGLFTILFYSLFSWNLPITDPVESNYTLTAKEMLLQKKYFSPLIYGNPWFDKPIFSYLMLIFSFKLFGFYDFAARIPGILASGLSVAFLYYFSLRITKSFIASFLSAFFLCTSFEFWYIGHAVVTDMWLFLFSVGIFGYAYLGLVEKSRKFICLAYFFAGLAVLTKGPIGLLLPGLILLVFLIYRRNKEDFSILFSPTAILLFCIVALPWYIYMYAEFGGEFINGFLGLHNYMRATVAEHPRQNVWYFYLLLLPISLLPWLGFFLYELKHMDKNRIFTHYSFIWATGVLFIYSVIATKYITYTFISLIPLVIISGMGGLRLVRAYRRRELSNTKVIIISALPLIFFSLILVIGSGFSDLVIPTYLSWYFLGLLLSLFLLWKKKKNLLILPASMCLTVILYLIVTISVTPLVNSRSSATWVSSLSSQYKDIYLYGEYRTSLAYYSGKTITSVIDKPHMDIWEKGKAVMPQVLASEVVSKLENTPYSPILVIVQKKYLTRFISSPLYEKVLFVREENDLHLFTNQ